jgi:hypothetical protein
MLRTIRGLTAALLCIAAVSDDAHAQVRLEKMLQGFLLCTTPDFYFDQWTGDTPHPELRASGLKPYKVDDQFAWYRLRATYLGLPVSELLIPASTWYVVSITFDVPLARARAHLKRRVGSEFRSGQRSEQGEVPALHQLHGDASRSALTCESAY